MTTIQELLREFRVDFATEGKHHHARSGWIAIRRCPFCSSLNYHLGFSLSRHFFNCWNCGGHGVISTLVQLGIPYPRAASFFRGQEPSKHWTERERGILIEPPGRGELQPAHLDYLRRRGFDSLDKIQELREVWELEGIGRDGGKLSWRIYIPISFRGVRVSWTSRAIGPEVRQRYVSASASEESINHRHVVYGIDLCQHVVIVVEGPADAWNVGPGAGALFGVDFSPAQVLLLSSFPRRIICFDSSPEAQRRAEDLTAQLSPFPGETLRVELDAEDPGSAPRKEIKLLRKMAHLT